jgi:hypothetical protein
MSSIDSHAISQQGLSRTSLKIIVDRPGEALVLEGEKVALCDFARGLAGQAVMGAVGGLMLSLSGMAGQSETLWLTHRLTCDRNSGTLVVDDVQIVTQEERSENIQLADIAKLFIRRGGDYWYDKENLSASDRLLLIEAVIHVNGGSNEHSLRLHVEGIDTREKIADLAYRIGGAIGLRYQRVVCSDPMRIEIEMRHEHEMGFEPMPEIDCRADYLRGHILAMASRATAEWHIQSFDPATFPSSIQITKWTPLSEIKFKRPFQSLAIGCLPFSIAAIAAGPVFWFMFRDQFSQLGGVKSFLSVGLTALLGLLFGGLGLLYFVSSLPRYLSINWSTQKITSSGLFRRKVIPFDHLTAVDLRWVKTTRDTNTPYRTAYHCVVNLQARGDDTNTDSIIEMTSTNSFQLEPYKPYDAALPLAKAITDSLAVPLHVTVGYFGPKRIGRR